MSVIYKGLRTRVLFKDFIRVPRNVSLIIYVSNKVQFESHRNRVSLGQTNKCLPPVVWFGCKTYQMETSFKTSVLLKHFHNFFLKARKPSIWQLLFLVFGRHFGSGHCKTILSAPFVLSFYHLKMRSAR